MSNPAPDNDENQQPAPQTAQLPESRFTWGAIVAIVALLVLGAVFAFLVMSGGKTDSATFASLTTAVVAIASAYFGIQVAGKAANAASTSAAAATKAADTAHGAAHAATRAANLANETTKHFDDTITHNSAALIETQAALDRATTRMGSAPKDQSARKPPTE